VSHPTISRVAVLLRTPAAEPTAGGCVPAFVPEDTSLARTDVVAVSYAHTADEWLAGYVDAAGVPPRRATVVEVDATTRSAVADAGTGPATGDGHRGSGTSLSPSPSSSPSPSPSASSGSAGVGPDAGRFAVETVEAADLTGLGTIVGERLDAWSDDGSVLVCFDSLTGLLRAIERQRAHRFLRILTARIAAVGAIAHVHFDPSAHDDRSVATVASAFEGTLELAAEGDEDEDGDGHAWVLHAV